MRKSVNAAVAVTLWAAGSAFAQSTLQQQVDRIQQQLQQLGSGNPSPELQQQVQQTAMQLMLLGRGGRGAAPPRAAAPAPYKCEPVNPNATPEARALLRTLCDVSGKGILTGQHNFPNERTLDTDRIFDVTGKYPAIWGSDFGFTDGEDKDAITHRDLMIAEARKQAAAGSIVYLCWHMLRPTEDEPGKPGSSWSGSVQARLYREVYNRMVNVHHLNNLVWVWNQNGPAPGGEFYNFFPGKNYCDVVSYDNYRTLDDRYYYEIQTIADGKPIALGEVGAIPSPEILKSQPKWTFFMTWAGMTGVPPQPPPPDVIVAQRQRLVQQLEDLQKQLQQLGTGTPSPELLQQAQRLAMQLGPLGGGRGGDPEAARQSLRDAFNNPYLLKRGDPIPK